MRTKFILSFISLIFLSNISFSQQRPQINFEDLMINAELDHRNIVEARKAAIKTGAPVSIYLEEGIFITAKGVENEKPVYAVMRNILHPSVNSEVMFYDEVVSSFNLETARINYGDGIILNPDIGFPEIENPSSQQVHHLLISESGNNTVMLLDFETGDLVKPDFIPPQSNLTIPKQARLSPFNTITISDQTEDVVFSYDTSGVLQGIFAPSIGPHTGILDNIRGHNYRPNNNLVVCNSQGGNFNRIVEFDSTGEYLGVFIQANSGGLLSPFDIIFRANDVLVSGSISGAAHRYDLNGNYLNDFVTGQLFPQQIVEFPNGNIGIANFGSTGELKIYDQNGILLNSFSSVSWIRGVHYLGSGNIIVTNSAGVHEIDGSTGNFLRTVVDGVDAQYVSPCEINLEIFTPVELAAFNASTEGNNVNLSWTTSSELNNLGFEVQRLNQSENIELQNWIILDFLAGKGTSSELNNYSYMDINVPEGDYLYRMKQIDIDGSFSYSNIVEVEISNPGKFVLFQNYPNPFNPDTRIEFYIPVDGYVSLKIYNSIGEEISVSVSEYRSAGKHSLIFSDENLPSGLYFYSLRSGTFFETRKMILMK